VLKINGEDAERIATRDPRPLASPTVGKSKGQPKDRKWEGNPAKTITQKHSRAASFEKVCGKKARDHEKCWHAKNMQQLVKVSNDQEFRKARGLLIEIHKDSGVKHHPQKEECRSS